MATYVHRLCENKECESHGTNPFTGEPKRSLCEITKNGLFKCLKCETEFESVLNTAKVKGDYPHYNASAGVVFNSYSEQRSFERKNKLEPM